MSGQPPQSITTYSEAAVLSMKHTFLWLSLLLHTYCLEAFLKRMRSGLDIPEALHKNDHQSWAAHGSPVYLLFRSANSEESMQVQQGGNDTLAVSMPPLPNSTDFLTALFHFSFSF